MASIPSYYTSTAAASQRGGSGRLPAHSATSYAAAAPASHYSAAPIVSSNYGYGGGAFSSYSTAPPPPPPARAPPAAPYAAAAPASSWYNRGTGAVSVQSAHASRGGIQQRQYTPGGASTSSHSSSTLSKLKTMAGYANFFVPPGASASHIHTATSNLARGGRGGRGGRGQQHPYNSRGGMSRGSTSSAGGRGRGMRGHPMTGGRPSPYPTPKAPPQPPKPPKPKDLTPLYENLGKTISPRSASIVLMDIVGAGNIDFKFVDAEYDDYEEFNYNEGYYPVMLHKCIGSISYKDQYWEHFACNVSKKESKEKVADILMPEIIGYKVKEQKSRVKQVNDRGVPAPFECLEDEIPYASLCSLAIYKLYEDWTSDGVDVGSEMYEFRGGGRMLASSNIEGVTQADISKVQTGGTGTTAGPSSSSSVNTNNLNFKFFNLSQPPPPPPPPPPAQTVQLPKGKLINPMSMNPVSALMELAPGVLFNTMTFGSRSMWFVTESVVQGKKFSGEASNKKESKTKCAKNVLKELYKIEYPEAPPGEDDDSYRNALYQEDVPQQFQGFRY